VPHTRRGRERGFDVPAETYDPERLHSLGRAGLHVATLGGNHIDDFGAEGIADTLEALTAVGIATCGAGLDLERAAAPARLERRGIHVGVLSFNCAGPRESWAAADKSGCAYVSVLRNDGGKELGPSAAQLLRTSPDPSSLHAFQSAIESLARDVDVVIVALHKGIVHTPAVLAGYERPIARAAVEAGASLVVGHHSHILRGIEVIGGQPVFHGLGNFVTVTRALNLDNPHPARQEWARKRREYPSYPFHPEAKHAMIADCGVDAKGRIHAGFLPCWILPSGQPEVHGRDARGQATLDYVTDISRRAGFTTEFEWEGDRVVIG
jgi:poly-gamma-glutamate capsule biosynthesis protein CapA/YwtB (metallophosphatase superfamily)